MNLEAIDLMVPPIDFNIDNDRCSMGCMRDQCSQANVDRDNIVNPKIYKLEIKNVNLKSQFSVLSLIGGGYRRPYEIWHICNV